MQSSSQILCSSFGSLSFHFYLGYLMMLFQLRLDVLSCSLVYDTYFENSCLYLYLQQDLAIVVVECTVLPHCEEVYLFEV